MGGSGSESCDAVFHHSLIFFQKKQAQSWCNISLTLFRGDDSSSSILLFVSRACNKNYRQSTGTISPPPRAAIKTTDSMPYLEKRPERRSVELRELLLHAREGLAKPLPENLVVGLRREGAPRLLVRFQDHLLFFIVCFTLRWNVWRRVSSKPGISLFVCYVSMKRLAATKQQDDDM